jgi:hypothetical protein
MIFLQMVNGLRYYPVANAVAQTFPHPVILNETGVPFALTRGGSSSPLLDVGDNQAANAAF